MLAIGAALAGLLVAALSRIAARVSRPLAGLTGTDRSGTGRSGTDRSATDRSGEEGRSSAGDPGDPREDQEEGERLAELWSPLLGRWATRTRRRRSTLTILRDNTALIALFAFLILKVLVISLGDVTTALAILRTAGLTSVVVGGLLSALPFLAAFLLSASSASAIWWCRRGDPRRRLLRRIPRNVLASVLAAGLASFFLTPWPVLLVSPLMGLVWGLAIGAGRPRRAERTRLRPLTRSVRYLAVAGTALVLAPMTAWALLYPVWLPHETVTLRTQGSTVTVVGYVLDDSGGWITILESGRRRVVRHRSDAVSERTLCRLRATEGNPLSRETAAQRLLEIRKWTTVYGKC